MVVGRFECCGAPVTGEHSDECPFFFNRKTLWARNQESIDIIVKRIADAIDPPDTP